MQSSTEYTKRLLKPEGNLNVPWELRGYSDMDYAGDNSTWKIMALYIVKVMELSSHGACKFRKKLYYFL